MVTIVRTIDDQWWQAQVQKVRAARDKSQAVRTAIIQKLIDIGDISPDDASTYIQIVAWGWTPTDVVGKEAIEAMPRARDLVLNQPPFNPVNPNRRGDPASHIGDAWYAPPGDPFPVGSYAESAGEAFEKFACNGSVSSDPFYYADWSLQWGDRLLLIWVRTK
jgi:hypothetical protein